MSDKPDTKVEVKHSNVWEIVGFFSVLIALIVFVLVGDWQWAVLLMLFAIYCAVMR